MGTPCRDDEQVIFIFDAIKHHKITYLMPRKLLQLVLFYVFYIGCRPMDSHFYMFVILVYRNSSRLKLLYMSFFVPQQSLVASPFFLCLELR